MKKLLLALLFIPMTAFASQFNEDDFTTTSSSFSLSWNFFGLCRMYNHSSGALLYSGFNRTYTVSGAASGATTYRLTCDANAGEPGAPSFWTPPGYVTVTVASVPGQPGSITGVPSTNSNGSVSWSWAASSGTVDYYQTRYEKNGSWTSYASNGTSRTESYSGLGDGTYRFRVRACNTSGCGSARTSGYMTVARTPSVPSSISTPNSDSDGSYSVSWGSASGADGYQLYRSTNGGSYSQVYSGSATSFSESGRAIGSYYTYKVRAYNTTGSYTTYSGYSSTDTTTVISAPPMPGALAVPTGSSSGSYTVRWDVSNAPAYPVTYQLYESSNGGSSYSLIASKVHINEPEVNINELSHTVSGKGQGSYLYRVRARRTVNSVNVYSSYRSGANDVDVAFAPTTPSSITVPSTDDDGAFTVSWGASSGHDGYKLYRSKNGGSYSEVYSGTSASYSQTGLSDGTYTYRVRAYNTTGSYTAYSGYRTASAIDVAKKPATPSSISVPSSDDNGAYSISWGASSGHDGYKLYRSVNGGSFSHVYTGTATSYAESGRSDGTYTYRVRAYNTVGSYTSYSSYRTSSNGVAVLNRPGTPGTITLPSTDGSGSTATISWGASTGSVEYYQARANRYVAAVGIVESGSWVNTGVTRSAQISISADGEFKFEVQACNASGCSSVRESAAHYVNVNNAPTITSAVNFSMQEDFSATQPISVYDQEQHTTTLEIVSQPSSGSVSISGHNITYTPSANWNGATSFSYRAKDAYGLYSSTKTATVSVAPVNDAPSASTVSFTMIEDSAQSKPVSVTDIEDESTTLHVVTQPANGNVSISGKSLTFTPNANWFGSTSFTYRPKDASGAYGTTLTANVTVSAVNDAPSADVVSFSMDEDTAKSEPVQLTDIEGESVTLHVVTQPSSGNVSISGSTLTYTPSANWNGSTSFTYRPEDASGLFGETRTANVTVLAVNDAPSANTVSFSMNEDNAQAKTVTITEVDGESTTLHVVTQPEGGNVVVTGNTLTFTPAANWYGTTSFTYRPKDASNTYGTTRTANVTVNSVNDAPVIASAQNFSGVENQSQTRVFNVSDVEGHRVDMKIATQPTGGSVVANGESITFTPDTNWTGTSSFDYYAQDTLGATSGMLTASVSVVANTSDIESVPVPVVVTSSAGLGVDTSAIDDIVTLQGSFRVSESGAATYSIPIALPSGSGGSAPSMSLNYSSQSGAGLAGMGWNLSASSAIERCRKVYSIDGVAAPIDFSKDDNFCLDGQRLILVEGSAGSTGAVYKPEIWDGSEVKVAAVDGNGNPDYFEVTRRDGTTQTYGNTDDSEFDIPGKGTLRWAISESRDNLLLNYNRIEYSYIDDTSGQRLSEINWAFGKQTTPAAQVVITYEQSEIARSPIYVHGHAITNDKRIQFITVNNRFFDNDPGDSDSSAGNSAWTEVRRIVPAYTVSSLNNGEYMTSVQQCVGASCGRASEFTYEGLNSDVELDIEVQVPEEGGYVTLRNSVLTPYQLNRSLKYTGSFHSDACTPRTIGDFNGDGRQDVIYVNLAVSVDKCGEVTQTASLEFVRGSSSQVLGTAVQIPSSQVGADAQLVAMDYNSDGISDIVYVNSNDQLIVRFGNPQFPNMLLTEQDIEDLGPNNRFEHLVNNWEEYYQPVGIAYDTELNNGLLFGDVNGDSLPDLIDIASEVYYLGDADRKLVNGVETNTIETFLNTNPLPLDNASPDPDPVFAPIDGLEASRYEITSHLVDWNNDSRLEIIANKRKFTSVYQGIGPGGEPLYQYEEIGNELSIYYPLTGTYYDTGVDVGKVGKDDGLIDINGDSLPDVWRSSESGSSVRIALNQGDSFRLIALNSSDYFLHDDAFKNPILVDHNGDGYQDVMAAADAYSRFVVIHWDPEANTFANTAEFSVVSYEDEPHTNGIGHAIFNMDTDGDGVSELVHIYQSTSTKYHYVYENKLPADYGLMTQVDNGLGAVTSLNYHSLSDVETTRKAYIGSSDALTGTPTYSAPSNAAIFITPDGDVEKRDANNNWLPTLSLEGGMTVVESVSTTAPSWQPNGPGEEGTFDSDALATIQYTYYGGLIQLGGRGFLGFGAIETEELQQNLRSIEHYRQDYPYRGRPYYSEQLKSDGTVIKSSTTDYSLEPSQRLGTYLVYNSTSVENSFDLSGAPLSVSTLNQDVDGYGNVTWMKAEVHDASEVLISEVITNNNYDYSDPESARFGRVTDVSVSNRSIGNDAVLNYTEFTYFPKGTHHQWMLETEKVFVGTDYELTTTHVYDEFGNAQKSSTYGRAGTGADSGVTRTGDTVTYDSRGRYVVSTTSPLGFTSSTVLERNANGDVLRARDSYGTVAYSEYTPMWQPYFSSTDTGGYSLSYQVACGADCGNEGVVKRISESATGAWGEVLLDAYGREVRARSVSLNGEIVETQTQYNAVGQVIATSSPTFVGHLDGGNFTQYNKAPKWSTTTYDMVGRLTSATTPYQHESEALTSGSTGSVTVYYTYNGLETTESNSVDSRSTRTIKRADGKVDRVVDSLNGEIRFTYDAMGNLTRTDAVADGSTIQTHIQYDHRGVKTGMTDADKGTYAYVTNAFGELIEQTDSRGNVTEIGYDLYGRKTYQQVTHGAENDDNINELTLYRYMDPSTSHGSAFNSGVERLGQLIEVAHSSGAISYDRNASFDSFAANDALYHEQYQLDGFGRAVGTIRRVDPDINISGDEELFSTFVTYDQYGRVFQEYDAANDDSAVQYEYNAYGFVTKLWDARRVNGELSNYFQETLAVDPRGNVVLEGRGDGNRVRRYFDVNGQIMLKITSPGGFLTSLTSDDDNLYTEYVQYRWDAFGNLEYRHDQSGSKNLKETFEYDILNRLTAAVTTGDISHNEAFAYDGHGNITSKTGMGSYTYQAGTHRVIATSQYGGNTWSDLTHCNDTSSANYCYDSAGNMTSDDTGRTLNYTAYDKPYRIESGAGHVTEFLYGPNRARYVRKDTNTEGELQTTFYVGNVEKIVYESGDYTIRRYVAGVGMIVQDYNAFDTALEAEDLRYFYKDHLGSLSIITNAAGNITAQMSFDAFGKRRDHANWSVKLDTPSTLSLVTQARTNRGYTGHEQLDEVELIHMNGRVYDANLGRFLSADTFVPDANNLQAYNRYSYVMNNPLNATDPSGHIPCELRPVLAVIVAAVLTYIGLAELGFEVMSWGFAAYSAGVGAIAGGIATGSWEGAMWGAISGFVFSGIGVAGGWETAAQAATSGGFWLSNAIAGGVLADLQGGKFATGFLAAGFSSVANGLSTKIAWSTQQVAFVGRTMISALVGGTASKISGGKFANGFVTSGLQSLVSMGLELSQSPVDRARNHIRKSAEGRKLLRDFDATGADIVLTSEENLSPNGFRNEFDPKTNTVYWDPTSALAVESGVQSPAMTLAHEMSHAVQFAEIGYEAFVESLTWESVWTGEYEGWPMQKRYVYRPPIEEVRATAHINIIERQLGEPVRMGYLDAGDQHRAFDVTEHCFYGANGTC